MQYFLSHKYNEGDCHFNDIQVQQLIGKGNSSVYAIQFKNKPAAMKQIIIKSQQQAIQVSNQIRILKELSQNNSSIIKYYGSFKTTRENGIYNFNEITYIVMERAIMSLQELVQHRIREEEMFSETQVLGMMKVLINTLNILERSGIAHCDIKPQNILIMCMETDNLQIKLCDIGSCRMTKQSTEEITLVGTVPFLAPELIKDRNKEKTIHNPFKSDAFSLGLCFIYVMIFKKFKTNERVKISESLYKQIIIEWIQQTNTLYFKNELISLILGLMLEFDFKQIVSFIKLKEIINEQIHTLRMKKNHQLKEAKNRHQSLFVEKIKKPVAGTFHTILNMTKRTDVKNTSISIGFRNTFRPIVQQVSTLKYKRKVVLKKLQITSTTIYSRKRLSPASSKRKMSILKNNITLPSIEQPSPILKQKSTMCEEFPDHRVVRLTPQNIEFIQQNIKSCMNKLIVLDNCYLNLDGLKELTIKVSQLLDLQVIVNNFKDSQTLSSLVVDLRKYDSKSKFKFNTFDDYKSIKSLNLMLDQSSILHYSNLFSLFLSNSLKKLALSLTKTKILPQKVSDLVSLIFKSNQLESFSIDLSNLRITEKENKNIIQSISKSKYLKALIMNLSNNNIQYTTQHLWTLPKNIEKLVYNYSHNDLRLIINNLSISLPSVKSTLKQLILDLSDTLLSTKQINLLFNSITKLNLEVLSLKLGYNQLDDAASKYIAKNIILLQNLSYLQLGLQNANIQTEEFFKIILSINKMFSKRLKTVSLTYNRFQSKQQILGSIIKQTKQQIKVSIIALDATCKIFLKIKSSPQIRRKSVIKKSYYCLNLHNPGQTYKLFSCVTCIQNKISNKNIYLCQFCCQSCNHENHNVVPVYGMEGNCGATFLSCKSDINQLPCSQIEGIVFQKGGRCLLCQKQYMCLSCISLCKNQHSHMVVENKNAGMFRCCGRKSN